jgi:hypothetical protein
VGAEKKLLNVSLARQERRAHIVSAAQSLLGVFVEDDFDPVHSLLCPVDVVMVAGAPWLRDGLDRDFFKDEAGYRKIGGGANTPAMAYFFRSAVNLIHYLKRQGFYNPRGTSTPATGMACFFDWDNRGRFNFSPDRSGIVTLVKDAQVSQVIMAVQKNRKNEKGYIVCQVSVHPGDQTDQALIGYSDLP